MTETQPDRQDAAPPHFILTLHGIRTFGQWQIRLERLARARGLEARFEHFTYGVFSLLSYAIPFLRWIRVRQFRRYLADLVVRHPDARIDIVAHSFGTYIAGRSIASLARTSEVKVDTVILAGSVLKVNFPWDEYKAKGVVRRVVNECGIEDDVLLVTQLFILLTGMAGRVGFTGIHDQEFRNRFYGFKHSGYFEAWGDPVQDIDAVDTFMWHQWMPLLSGHGAVEPHDERVPTRLTSLQHFLLNFADPIKLAAYTAIVAATVGFPVYSITRKNAELREARHSLESYASATSTALQAFGRSIREDRDLRNRPELAKTRKKLLGASKELFDALMDRVSKVEIDSDDVEMNIAEAYLEMAQITVDLEEDPKDAIESFNEALTRLERQNERHPNSCRVVWAMGRSHTGRGERYIDRWRRTRVRTRDAEDDIKKAVDLLDRLVTAFQDSKNGLTALQMAPPKLILHPVPGMTEEECRRSLAASLMLLGNLAIDQKVALELYGWAAKVAAVQSAETGWIHNNKGERLLEAGNHQEAEASYAKACEVFEPLIEQSAGRTRAHEEGLAWALLGRGKAIVRQLPRPEEAPPQRRDECLKHLRGSRDVFSRLDHEFVDSPRHRLGLASSCKDLGEAIRAATLGNDEPARKEAVDALADAIKIYEGLPREQVDVTCAWAEHSLGWVLVDLGLIQSAQEKMTAESLLSEAVAHFEKSIALRPEIADFRVGQGFALITEAEFFKKKGFPGNASKRFESAERIFQALQEQGPPPHLEDPIRKGLEAARKAKSGT